MTEAEDHVHEPHYFEQKSRNLQLELKKCRDATQKLKDALLLMLHRDEFHHANCESCKQAVGVARHAVLAAKGAMK
jgi:hypothetical protein